MEISIYKNPLYTAFNTDGKMLLSMSQIHEINAILGVIPLSAHISNRFIHFVEIRYL